MILIPTADLNSQSIEAVLDDEVFYVILDWNESGQYWELGIRNSAYRTVVDGICVSPNYPLLEQFKYPDLPRGDIQCVYTGNVNGAPGRKDFVDGKFELIYMTSQEILSVLHAIR